MKKLFWFNLLMFMAVSMLSCADKNTLSSSPVYLQSVSNFGSIMTRHPEIATASLKEIKDAATLASVKPKSQKTMAALSLSTSKDEPVALKKPALDHKVAKEAQDLIDKVLEEFDIKSQIDSHIKLIGVTLKMAAQEFSHYKDEFSEVKMPTCEEFVKNPMPEKDANAFMKIVADNKKSLKASMSGCAKIQGKEFITCIDYINRFASFVNENVSCDVDDLNKLDEIFNKEFPPQGEGDENIKCTDETFKKCGYNMIDVQPK